ncbi:MAG TPA: hypothetical protein DCL61_15395, partial [Cyanobacteria bacterium UBA12227]|nr:hypothetical protein [Cyanobacteria bacterium UBA12227]
HSPLPTLDSDVAFKTQSGITKTNSFEFSSSASMTYSLRIADIPASERPRERLMSQGAKNLATAELIAILLGTGQGKGKLSAVGLGQYIL